MPKAPSPRPKTSSKAKSASKLPGEDSTARDLLQEIRSYADPKKVPILSSFFKTGKGQYGEGDLFLGIQVPPLRKLSKKYRGLPLSELQKVVSSKYHEERLAGFFVLCETFQKSTEEDRKKLHEFYLKNMKYVNNWDLVDLSARDMIGEYLIDKDRKLLYKLARSKDLWEKRISMIATYAFIRKGDYADTYKIAEILLRDKEDLIHKVVGWMLREAGNRDLNSEIDFLDKHAATMPRTMLRYAIEKFPEKLKKKYMLAGKS
ncbi:DNA alkylation repair protein [Leptospira langatensis]|uniref:DNA alkylation repair protein n=1 Tax=Leptospira langatensis TaxID=2484983 RepID=A0A5F1ZTL8_9LEPT|nr:DNA alkylation repair protein [Leptospira langatensis]TGK00338.1 DNA alkylation repair protein [Leptospira langatensis]TGL41207.1 DNA alkylation repair protein [Leptospira langatensis]